MENFVNPERKAELTALIQAYLERREQNLQKPTAQPVSTPCYSIADEQEEPAKADWDALVRIFHRRSEVKDVQKIVEQAKHEETFSEALLRIIQEKQFTEPEVYNAVFMDRRLFNKIRNTPDYQPNLRTALLLAVALELTIDETREFIGKAGFRLSPWRKFDVIVEYFIVNRNYDVMEINEMLAEFDQPLLLKME